VKQLDPYSQGGLIAISIDYLVKPHKKVLKVSEPLEATKSMDSQFLNVYNWLMSKDSTIRKRIKGRNVIAFLITGNLPVFIKETGLFLLETRYEIMEVSYDIRHSKLSGLRSRFSSFS